MTLLLSKGDTGDGVIDGIRNLIGPPDVDKAKEEAPEWYDNIGHVARERACTIETHAHLLFLVVYELSMGQILRRMQYMPVIHRIQQQES